MNAASATPRPPLPARMCILLGAFALIPLSVMVFLPQVDGLVRALWGFLLAAPMLWGLALASLWYDRLLVRGGLAILSASAVVGLLLGIYDLYLILWRF